MDEDRPGVRSFVIAHHPAHGYLLLQASKWKKGGVHYQLPGGWVDDKELQAMGVEQAARVACARELKEETGLDVTGQLHRLEAGTVPGGKNSLNGRYYYRLQLGDGDSVKPYEGQRRSPVRALTGQDFHLRLSMEHTGFVFEPDTNKAASMIVQHSGGKNSQALRAVEGYRNMMKNRTAAAAPPQH
eukprot:comp22554_c0_seq1/m.34319 comp22554_c0_seq1/g.34319  ORF comp22554_c0_seq1/g.34319 comp22554_c0_seq1/m.34319 type:complete len:186 (-) comp22554_c0_seq1:131-688(-)